MKHKKTSLKSLSAHLGLSTTTVSRGLAGYPEVSKATKKRIKDAAIQLDYVPNNYATRLSKGYSHTIGHIIPLSENKMIHPIFADFIAGAGEIYAEHDFDFLFSVVSKKKEIQTYRALANSGKVDGFILSAPTINDPRIACLQEMNIPYVVHGRSIQSKLSKNFSWVDVDNEGGFFKATEYLISLGHKHIGLLNGHEEFNFALERRLGFEMALEENQLELNEAWNLSSQMSEQEGFRLTLEIVQSSERPSAILCSSYLIALGASRAIQQIGLKIADEISIMCWDDCLSYLKQNHDNPYFTCIQSSVSDAGRNAALMIIDIIKNPDVKIKRKLMKGVLKVGHSTGKPQTSF